MRIRILELLAGEERSVTDLQEALSAEQSMVSQQLGILRRAGAVTSVRTGSTVRYSLSDERIADVLETARAILIDAADRARHQLEEA